MSNNTNNDVNYGPLAGLIGTWKGNKGQDIAPDPDGTEENAYYEVMEFEGIGEVSNAESENLVAVRYNLSIGRIRDDKSIHNQTGYWLWDYVAGTLMHSFSIPRGVAVLAGGVIRLGQFDPANVELQVKATLGDKNWGILESPFMQENASTKSFAQTMSVTADELRYSQTMMVDIYGKSFEHTDENVLIRS